MPEVWQTGEILTALERLKNSGCWERRDRIAELLGFPEESYVPMLEEWLRSGSDGSVRNIAMEAYRAMGCRAHSSLVGLLRDGDPDVRVFAANLLGDINDRDAVAGLIESLNDAEVNVRVAAAEALGKIGDEGTVCDLASALNGSSWEAMAAIDAIGRIGGARALQVLHQCFEWEEYRLITCEAIGRAGRSESLHYLEDCASGEALSGPVLTAVVEIAEREGIRPAPEFLSRMVPFLMELQESPLDDVKRAAFIALSWSGDGRGLPFFVDALDDPELQEYAISGLVSLGEGAAEGLVGALRQPGSSRAALAKVISMTCGGRSLFPFVTDEDPEVRTEAALAIGKMRSREALDALALLVNDPAEEVREVAKQAIEAFRNGDTRS